MITIKPGQLDQFLQHDEPEFIDMIINDFLKPTMPELVGDLSMDALRSMVSYGLAKARAYQYSTDENLMAFIGLLFETAPNFYEQPDIHKALIETATPVEQSISAIFDKVPPEAWQQAEDNYDSDAWFPELKASEE